MNRRKFLKGSAVGVSSMAVLRSASLAGVEPGEKESGALNRSGDLDIAPFGRRCGVEDRHAAPVTFDFPAAARGGNDAEQAADGRYIYGLQWAEERDIKEVSVRFKPGAGPENATVEYWSLNWPYPPPRMPKTSGYEVDPWQGKWLKAATKAAWAGSECRYTFQPLEESENPRAGHLPGVDYRRALKVRLVFAAEPALDGVQIFTGSVVESVRVRMELGAGERDRYEWKGGVSVYDGELRGMELWQGSTGDTVHGRHFRLVTEGSPKGLVLDLAAAKPSLPGSEDITIVTLEAGERTFSFAVPDLRKGPIYVPVFHAYVSLASDERAFSPSIVNPGAKIRERIPQEAEQSYERASKEIPALNPADATEGRVFFPLAVEASWQKFAVEWGGAIILSRGHADLYDEEQRLEWQGNLSFRIGTGTMPNYRPMWKDSTLSVLEDYLPVTMATWSTEGIEYTEECFATLISGPLSPDDPGRSEQTPAVLMVKLQARNPGSGAATAHLWLATDPDEEVGYQLGELVAQGGDLVRARLKLPDTARSRLSVLPYGGRTLSGIHLEMPLGAGEQGSVILSIPFIPRLTVSERGRLGELDYQTERTRVVEYWQGILAQTGSFDVPDERMMKFMKAVVPHILIAVTKHPKSGLYFIPAGTIGWLFASNEGMGQCLILDALGHSSRVTKYMETWIQLQGKIPVPGTFSNQRGFYNVYWDNVYSVNAGSVLGGLAEHYFFARDQEWLRRVAPSMKLAADWMIEQRKLTEVLDGGEKVPEYGLLPAGKQDDQDDWGHWMSVNAESVWAITRLAEALADIGAPEATHYAEEASAYKRDLRAAVAQAARRAAVIRLRDNTYVPYVPTRVHQRIRDFGPMHVGYYSRYRRNILPLYYASATHEVYVGPITLLLRDMFHREEPLADWILDDWEDNATTSVPLGVNVHGWVEEKYWFSRGGMVFQAAQNPAPVYLRRNEVPAGIRSTYNSFVALYYPELNCLAEEYHEWGKTLPSLIKTYEEARVGGCLRDMLVREEGETIWLASGAPRRWLAAGEKIELQNAPTYFGPVSYRMEASAAGVEARVELPTRNKFQTAWLMVRAPNGKSIRKVEMDGKPWTDFDAAGERVRLPTVVHALRISVRF